MRCIKISTWKGTLLIRNKNGTSQRDEFVKQLRNPGSAYSIDYLPIDKYNSNTINEIGPGTKVLALHACYVKEDYLSVLVE